VRRSGWSVVAAITVSLLGCAPSAAEAPDTAPPSIQAASPSATPAENIGPTASVDASITPGAAPIGPTETAVVLRIVDGDTIEVDRGNGPEKLRYIGVDTPETIDPGSPVEWMGPEASKANAELVEGQTVLLEHDVSETDQYGRLLRYVWVEDASAPSGWLMVNLALVTRGFAQVATYPPDVRYVDLYLGAQREAKAAAVGLWGAEPILDPTPDPTPPSPKPGADCHSSYLPCLSIVDDLDCADVRAMGAAPVKVIGPDEYRLDGDYDGRGCE